MLFDHSKRIKALALRKVRLAAQLKECTEELTQLCNLEEDYEEDFGSVKVSYKHGYKTVWCKQDLLDDVGTDKYLAISNISTTQANSILGKDVASQYSSLVANGKRLLVKDKRKK